MRRFVRFRATACALACLAACSSATIAAQMPKYGVTVTADKKTDFTKFKTYRWETGWQSYDKTVHQQIVAAVDRELKGLGFEKKESGPTDVTMTYGSLRRTDVDLKSKPTQNEAGRREFSVGSLVVLMKDFKTRKELFRARADKPIDTEADKLQATIDGVVTEMFAKYPTRAPK